MGSTEVTGSFLLLFCILGSFDKERSLCGVFLYSDRKFPQKGLYHIHGSHGPGLGQTLGPVVDAMINLAHMRLIRMLVENRV